MKISKEELKSIILRKRAEMEKKLIQKNPKENTIRYLSKNKIKKVKLAYELFLQ